TFAGKADTGFGASSTVKVNVYAGSSATGTPVQAPTTSRGGDGSYSVSPSPSLAPGQYTAQAEQTGGADEVGKTAPVTFTLQNPNPPVGPPVVLNSPGGPLTTATPTLTGTAGSASGDSQTVALAVYRGLGTSGTPYRSLTGIRDAQGHFSIRVTPALPD